MPMQLQLIPAEMLPHMDNRETRGAGAARVEMGIEFDAIGRRAAYHFLREHPGNPRAGRGGAAPVPPDRRRPDPRRAAHCLVGGEAGDDGPVRRRRAGTEALRGALRRLHHPAAGDRRGRRDPAAGRSRPGGAAWRRPRTRRLRAARTGRGCDLLEPGGRRRQLRGFPVPHADGDRVGLRRALRGDDGRSPADELQQHPCRAGGVPPAGRGAAAPRHDLPALPPRLDTVVRRRGAGRGFLDRPRTTAAPDRSTILRA